jgi:hypothetical protein
VSYTTGGPRRPLTNEMIRKMIATTKSTWAIQAASPAVPLNPKISAMMATTRKISAQRNIRIYTPETPNSVQRLNLKQRPFYRRLSVALRGREEISAKSPIREFLSDRSRLSKSLAG